MLSFPFTIITPICILNCIPRITYFIITTTTTNVPPQHHTTTATAAIATTTNYNHSNYNRNHIPNLPTPILQGISQDSHRDSFPRDSFSRGNYIALLITFCFHHNHGHNLSCMFYCIPITFLSSFHPHSQPRFFTRVEWNELQKAVGTAFSRFFTRVVIGKVLLDVPVPVDVHPSTKPDCAAGWFLSVAAAECEKCEPVRHARMRHSAHDYSCS